MHGQTKTKGWATKSWRSCLTWCDLFYFLTALYSFEAFINKECRHQRISANGAWGCDSLTSDRTFAIRYDWRTRYSWRGASFPTSIYFRHRLNFCRQLYPLDQHLYMTMRTSFPIQCHLYRNAGCNQTLVSLKIILCHFQGGPEAAFESSNFSLLLCQFIIWNDLLSA